MAKIKKDDDGKDNVHEAFNDFSEDVKNYITPSGFERLQDEFYQLKRIERPKIVETVSWAASNGDRSENGDYIYGKKKLREIDNRLRFLIKRMEIAEVVNPNKQKNQNQIFFGATVRFSNSSGKTREIKIVGVDEARIELNEISLISPVARALMRASCGDTVELETPTGLEKLKILKIFY